MNCKFCIRNISDSLIIFQRKDYIEEYKLAKVSLGWHLIAPEEHQLKIPINKYNRKPNNSEIIKDINIYLMENPWD